MKKLYLFRNLLLLIALGFAHTALAADVLWQTSFSSQEDFQQWQVVDANNDGVSWEYVTEQAPGPVIYRYHYSNPADDWFVSPAITPVADGTLMVRYTYYGSFYSEQMEVYYGPSAVPEEMEKKATHIDLKNKDYESFFFVEAKAGEAFHLAFRATSLAYKQHLYLKSLAVEFVGSSVASDYPNRVTSASGLTLAAPEKYVGTDAATEVDFAVFDGEEDVTNAATLYVYGPGGERNALTSPQYVCTAPGDYRFYATYADKSSMDAQLTIKALHHLPALPDDAQPASTDFLTRALILQGTGVQCGYCPNGKGAIRQFFSEYEQADRVCNLAYHSYTIYDPLYCEAADVMYFQIGLRAYPNMQINFSEEWETTGLTKDGFMYFLNESVTEALNNEAKTNVALSAAYNAEEKNISVQVGVKTAEPGLYRVTVALLQDSVYAYQAGALSEADYTHNAALRALSPANGEGAYLDCGSCEVAGGVYQYACEFSTDNLVQTTGGPYTFNPLTQARVVAYVKRMDGLLDNVVACRMNEAVEFAYTSVAPEEPTVGIEKIGDDFSSPSAEVEVYDLFGHQRAVVRAAELRTSGLPKGMYILREKGGAASATKKVLLP